jgi:hypothetical protein
MAAADTLIMADGFSCREQISQCTDRHALHLAEVIQIGLKGEPAGAGYPESDRVRQRQAAVQKSVRAAALGVAAVAGGIGLLYAMARRL